MIGIEEEAMETAMAPVSVESLAQLLTNKGASSDEAEFVRKHNITCNTIDDLFSTDLSHGFSVGPPGCVRDAVHDPDSARSSAPLSVSVSPPTCSFCTPRAKRTSSRPAPPPT